MKLTTAQVAQLHVYLGKVAESSLRCNGSMAALNEFQASRVSIHQRPAEEALPVVRQLRDHGEDLIALGQAIRRMADFFEPLLEEQVRLDNS